MALATLTGLAHEIGIREFSITRYAGSNSVTKENSTTMKQYNFIIEPKLTSNKLNEGFVFADISNGMPEFLNADEIKALALILEKKNIY